MTQSANGTITPAPLTVSATGVNKVYDTTTTANVTLSDNHFAGDSVTDTSQPGVLRRHVVAGTGKPIAVSGIAIIRGRRGATIPCSTPRLTPQPTSPAAIFDRHRQAGVDKVRRHCSRTATVLLSDDHPGRRQRHSQLHGFVQRQERRQRQAGARQRHQYRWRRCGQLQLAEHHGRRHGQHRAPALPDGVVATGVNKVPMELTRRP